MNSSTQLNSKLFVGGIPHDISSDEIRAYFETFGLIKTVDLPIKKKTGKLRGFAIVQYAQSASAMKALATKKHILKGKCIAVRKGMDNKQASEHTRQLQARKIYSKGFPINTTEEDICSFFSRFGKVDRVLMGNSSGGVVFKGFAYVIMENKKGFNLVFQSTLPATNQLEFKGILIEVEPSKTQEEVKNSKKASQPSKCAGRSSKKTKESSPLVVRKKNKHFKKQKSMQNKVQRSFKGKKSSKLQSQTSSQRVSIPSFESLNSLEIKLKENNQSSNWSYPRQGPHFHRNYKTNRQQQQPTLSVSVDSFTPELTGEELVRKHHLIFRSSAPQQSRSASERNLVLNHPIRTQSMNFTALYHGGDFSNQNSRLPRRESMFGPQNAFGENSSDPTFMTEGDGNLFLGDNLDSFGGDRQYWGPVFIPGRFGSRNINQEEEDQEQSEPAIEIKQIVTTEYLVKNQGKVYNGTVNETNVWGSHPHLEF